MQIIRSQYFLLISLILLCPTVLFRGELVLAQSNLQNPLEITEVDPLLPAGGEARSLTDPERRQLANRLGRLDQQAKVFLQAGDLENTVLVWNRFLRLSRSLGTIPEIQALGRIGDVAWNQNITKQVNTISDRLQVIQRSQPEKIDIPTLQALGTAYQQLRSPNLAIPIYRQLLAQAKEKQDINATENNLRILGQLHMDWFDYPQAALTYQELFDFSVKINDIANQVSYLEELAYIYDQLKDQEKSIAIKQKLINYYQAKPELQVKIPDLLVNIGSSYTILGNPQAAKDNYQRAYEIAIAGKQFAAARDALQGLALLYRTYNQPNTALQIYQILIQVNQQSYDYYDSMNTYDQMGQIYLQQKDYAQAINVFLEGLKIARSLQYQELYFSAQVERMRTLLTNNSQ
jgi:tetratricopeptide (TPR) repeat protein